MNGWESEFIGTDRESQFFAEAEAALPMPAPDHRLETIFEGVTQQRMRLRMNQQLAEWHGLGRVWRLTFGEALEVLTLTPNSRRRRCESATARRSGDGPDGS